MRLLYPETTQRLARRLAKQTKAERCFGTQYFIIVMMMIGFLYQLAMKTKRIAVYAAISTERCNLDVRRPSFELNAHSGTLAPLICCVTDDARSLPYVKTMPARPCRSVHVTNFSQVDLHLNGFQARRLIYAHPYPQM